MSTEIARSGEYALYHRNLMRVLGSKDPKHVRMVQAANESLARMKSVSPGTVHVDSTMANLSVQYKNEEYIGLQLMPIVNVGKRSDVYFVYDKRSRLAYPDDSLGARGEANEVEDARSTANYSVRDYGFKNYVDAETLSNQDAPLNEMIDLVEAINEGVDFKEEKRIATILTNSANFGSSSTLSGTSQWDNGASNPVKDIQTAMAAIWSGRGPSEIVGYCGLDVANALMRHPMLLDMFKYTQQGLVPMQRIADFFGMSRILVGKAREDTANDGQTVSYSRIWGKYFGIVRVANRASVRNASFGYTFRKGPKETSQWFDISKGKGGGYYARVALSEDHKVVASDTGYLFSAAIS